MVEFASELVRRSPAEKSYRHTLAVGYSNLSQAESKLGKPAAAERSMGQALLLQEALVKQDTSDVEEQSALGAMYNDLGVLLEKVSRSSDAAAAYQQAVAHQRQAVASTRRATLIAAASTTTTSITHSCYGKRDGPAMPRELPPRGTISGPTTRRTEKESSHGQQRTTPCLTCSKRPR